MGFLAVPEDLLPVLVPTAVYWIVSGIYGLLIGPPEKHRLFTREEEDTKNLVTRKQVLVVVLINQVLQTSLAVLVFMGTRGEEAGAAAAATPHSSLLRIASQLAVAFVVGDAWQYFWHRFAHMNKFVYKHLHSMHHRIIVPYSYGTWYIHPLDAFFGDLIGGFLANLLSGMSPRTSAIFFTLITLKAVDDHCGMWFANHPINRFLTNNCAFHTVHHQGEGLKYNFSGHYFAVWDKLLGTYLPYSVQERKGGGYQLRIAKDD